MNGADRATQINRVDTRRTKKGHEDKIALGENLETLMIEFLRKNAEMFAWSLSDFKGINPEVIIHRLNVNLMARTVKQKKRSFGAERNRIIEEEVGKLVKAGYVAEVKFTEWLANVVVVLKAVGKWRMCTDYTDLNKAYL
ncbi:UNVERIFIED_CONTAM: hypothetical protein Sangu_2448400 [Sesamum angustifolium]|uniref:Uncharacterized protein n=1 Tax=Sesamum angustifolium TaxID=2727405 RepID=A0AAW2KX50_9LAMI